MKKRIVAIVLFVAMLLGISPLDFAVPAFADASGTCGDNLTWSYDGSTTSNNFRNKLTINGTGDMYDYSYSYGTSLSTAPWSSFSKFIKEIEIGNNVTGIGKYAFYGCSVASITVPNSVVTIGDYAFYGCNNLANITLGNSLLKIGSAAFWNNSGSSNLTSITIPDSVISIGEYAFYGCSFEYVKIGNGLDGIPAALSPCESSAFQNTIKTYIVGNGVTSIGDEFKGCSNLNNISFGNNIKSIKASAFDDCEKLNIYYTGSIADWAQYSFLTYNAGNHEKHLFINNVELTEIKESDLIDVSSIGNAAFASCYGLKRVEIPSNIITMGENAFEGCPDLLSVSIDTDISYSSFKDCCSLTDITLKNGAKNIGKKAFFCCSSLESVVFSEALETIGDSAFEGSGLTEISLPNSVSSLGEKAFMCCERLEKVIIGNGITTIKTQTFWGNTVLKKIYLGKNVKKIENNVFYDSNELSDVYLYGYVTYSNDSGSNNPYKNARLHYYKEVAEKPATCIATGTSAYTCWWNDKYPVEYIEEPVELSINPDNHSPAVAIRENEKMPTCSANGSYEKVVNCSLCGKELSRETIIIPACHTPSNAVRENETFACVQDGSYDSVIYCAVCGDEISRETIIVPIAGHTPAPAVEEKPVDPLCTKSGSYESVVYCSVCGDELSRETITVNPLGHDLIHHEGKASTCEVKGYSAYDTCSRCDYTTYSELPLADHAPATAVKENTVAATCTENGSYDSVVYCSVCGEELSRKTETTAKTGHKDKNNDGVCDICGTVTDTAKHNAYLLGKAKINVKSSATVDYRSTVTVTATASGLPEGYVLALYEGSSLKAKGSATSVSYNAGELMGNKTFTVKVVNSGNTPQKDSSGKEVSKTVEVKVKSGFFDKLIAFFRNLFGSLPKVEIKP